MRPKEEAPRIALKYTPKWAPCQDLSLLQLVFRWRLSRTNKALIRRPRRSRFIWCGVKWFIALGAGNIVHWRYLYKGGEAGG